MTKINAVDVDSICKDLPIRYSVCTLLTNKEQYEKALESFKSAGFSEPECEFLYIDNTQENRYDAYVGINKFLLSARGEYIILCHQDIIIFPHDIKVLNRVIEDVEKHDCNWALLGNAGGVAPGRTCRHLTDGLGKNKRECLEGEVPAKVSSLDENFIIVKRSANLSVSRDLSGFHMYGTDLCIIANILGYSSYVVGFHIWHYGEGNSNAEISRKSHSSSSFREIRKEMIKKYRRAFRSRYIQTTCTILYISESKIKSLLFNTKYILSFQKRFHSIFSGK